MKATWKKILSLALSACMAIGVCSALVGCGPKDPKDDEVKVTDGVFTGTNNVQTWTLKLKENGTYYNKHAYMQTAGTWVLLEESMEYNSALKSTGVDEDEDNPVMKTATQVIQLSEYNGETIKYAYDDNKIWGVEMDYGMSHKILTHDPEYNWDESTETPVIVAQYFDAKDNLKSIQLNHNGSYRDSLNDARGTWTVSNNVYTLTTTSGTATLTPNADGAVYKAGSTQTQLYTKAFEQKYAFTGELTAKLKGAEEEAKYEFRLALYENGDADIGFYDAESNYTAIESGKYTYNKNTEAFSFDFNGDANDKSNLTAAGGVYTIKYKDVGHNIFEQKSAATGWDAVNNVPIMGLVDQEVELTYEMPALYEMNAVKGADQDYFGQASHPLGYGTVEVPTMRLQLFANGKAAIYFTLTKNGETPLGEYLLDEGTYTKTATGYNINLTNGTTKELTATINKETNKVTTSAYTFTQVPIAALYLNIDIENVTFEMPYVKDLLYSFDAQTIAVSNPDVTEKFMPTAVKLYCYNDNSYEVLVEAWGTEGAVIQTGTYEMSALSIFTFTKAGANEPTFTGNLTAFTFSDTVAIVLEEFEDNEVDYGTLTVTFAETNNSGATLTAVAAADANFGNVKIVFQTVDMSVVSVSLVLKDDGTATLNALTKTTMDGFDAIYGSLDTATYTVSGNTYTFVFANAGTVSGTVSNGVLTLTYAPAEAAQFTPFPVYMTFLGSFVSEMTFTGMNITLSGKVA